MVACINVTGCSSYQHGGLESTEIQKKMPRFGTYIFWSGVPQGSQKSPYGNIRSMSWRENSTFQIYVLKIDHNLQEKEGFFVDLNTNGWQNFTGSWEKVRFFTFSDPADMFRHKIFEIRLKNVHFAAMWRWKTSKLTHLWS